MLLTSLWLLLIWDSKLKAPQSLSLSFKGQFLIYINVKWIQRCHQTTVKISFCPQYTGSLFSKVLHADLTAADARQELACFERL